jgi:hypothetical protein
MGACVNAELERQIVEKHPHLYRNLQPRWSDAPLFECEDGWREIIEELSLRLAPYAASDGLAVTLIKQKLGTLSVSAELDGCDDGSLKARGAIDSLIREAEEKSRLICELCGSAGRIRDKGRFRSVRALCESCAAAKGYASA